MAGSIAKSGEQIVDAIRSQGGFDVDRETALGWANEKYASQVARARVLRDEMDGGNISVGVTRYAIPDGVVAVESIDVAFASGTAPWTEASVDELRGLKSGRLRLRGRGGVFVERRTATGGRELELYPTPTEAGALTLNVVVEPAPLEDSPTSFPVTDPDTHDSIIDGGIAIGLARIDENIAEADRYEARYEAKTAELERREKMKVGEQTGYLRIQGIHF